MRGLFQETPLQDKRREGLFDVRQRGACVEAAVPLCHGARRKAPWMWVRGYEIVLSCPSDTKRSRNVYEALYILRICQTQMQSGIRKLTVSCSVEALVVLIGGGGPVFSC